MKIPGMHRRRVLLGGAAAVGLLGVAPFWIRVAFAKEADCAPRDALRSLAALSGAFRRAHAAGRSLLVLVIPESDELKYRRGSLFGVWLNHATDSQLAPLSRCEIACATMADVRKLVPNAPKGEPLMVLIDPSGIGGPTVALDIELPQSSELESRILPIDEAKDFETLMREREARENAMYRTWIAKISRVVQNTVAPGIIFNNPAGLAAHVRRRWVAGKVPGARWALSGGCGIQLEDEAEQYLIACGMGHVPEKARRFLYFYAKSPYERMNEEISEP